MPTPSELRPAGVTRYVFGQVVAGKYRLDSLLGEGGMGAVWRAFNLQLEAPIALKLIRADLEQGQLGPRLKQEARAAAKLGHPAIVRLSRASLASLTSSPPESGTRSVMHSAATLPSAPARPERTSQSPDLAPPGRSRAYLSLGIAGVPAAVLAFALGLSSRHRAANPSRSEPAPPLPSHEPASAVPPSEVLPVHSASETVSGPSTQPHSRPHAAPVPLKREKRLPPTSSVGNGPPAAPAPVAPTSDLLSPY